MTRLSAVPTLYLAICERSEPARVLLFEESLVHSHMGGTAAAGRQPRLHKGGLWHRMKEHYEDISLEMFASDRFVRRANFDRVKVMLNKPLEAADVRDWIARVIRDNSFHHLRWLIIDGILLPISVLAMFLPGPNIVGYYLLFRVISHGRSYWAASRAKVGEVELQVSPRAEEVSAVLCNNKSGNGLPEALHRLRHDYGLRAVQEHKLVPQGQLIKAAWRKMREQVTRKGSSEQ